MIYDATSPAANRGAGGADAAAASPPRTEAPRKGLVDADAYAGNLGGSTRRFIAGSFRNGFSCSRYCRNTAPFRAQPSARAEAPELLALAAGRLPRLRAGWPGSPPPTPCPLPKRVAGGDIATTGCGEFRPRPPRPSSESPPLGVRLAARSGAEQKGSPGRAGISDGWASRQGRLGPSPAGASSQHGARGLAKVAGTGLGAKRRVGGLGSKRDALLGNGAGVRALVRVKNRNGLN